MSRIPSNADRYCDADHCPNCKGVLTERIFSKHHTQMVCENGDCFMSEEFEPTDTPSLKMDKEDQLVSALSAIAFTRESDPVVLKKMARDALVNVPVGVAGEERFRNGIIQVVAGIDALLDDQQVITLRMQDGEFAAHIKRDGRARWSNHPKSWILCMLGVTLDWASDGDLSPRGGK